MYSKVKILGHPVHAMLVGFPVTFYTSTLACFIVYAITGNPFWHSVGTVTNWAGVATAGLAAIPGLIDWSVGVPRGTPAKATGLQHMLLNVLALGAFVINGLMQLPRFGDADPGGAGSGIVLSAIGVLLTIPAGFLGWNLIQRHHVGVQLTPDQELLEPTSAAKVEPPRPPPRRPLRPAPQR